MFKALTFRATGTLTLRYRVLPVLTSTRVENYSLAAALTVIRAQRADHLPFSLEVMPASLVYTNFLSADF